MKSDPLSVLDQLPKGWKTVPLAALASVNARIGWKGLTAAEYVDEGFAFLAAPNLKGAEINWAEANFITKERYEESPEIALRRADVLLVKDGSIGIVAVVRELPRPTTVNGSIAIVRPKAIDPEFLALWLTSKPMQEHMVRMQDGMGVPHLFQRDIRKFRIPVPDRTTQAQIAVRTRQEIAWIDSLIAQKERLLALLEEKRRGIVGNAVTNGLDPNVPMRDSGVPQIGDVPSWWEVRRLKQLVRANRRITYGIVLPGDPEPRGRFMIRGQDYSRGWASPESIFRVSPMVEEPFARSRVEPGDIVLTIVGAGTGNVAIVPNWLDGANITQTTARIAVDPHIADAQFIKLVLESHVGSENTRLSIFGAAQPRLNIEHVKDFPVPCPPVDEQRAIVADVARHLEHLERLLDRLSTSVSLLRERRQSFITAAVTGQLNLSAHLPKEARV